MSIYSLKHVDVEAFKIVSRAMRNAGETIKFHGTVGRGDERQEIISVTEGPCSYVALVQIQNVAIFGDGAIVTAIDEVEPANILTIVEKFKEAYD